MRIVYLHQYFNTPSDAGGTRSYEFARRWAAAGHDVHVVTSDQHTARSGRRWREVQVAGFTVHYVNVPYSNAMSYRRRLAAFARFAVLASVRSRRLHGDIVFATSTPLTIAIPAMFATTLSRSRMVFEVRDLWPTIPIAMGALKGRVPVTLARLLERIAYRRSAEVVALSDGMKAGVTATGYDPQRVTVVPNSSDIDRFGGVSQEDVDRWRTLRPELGQRRIVLYCGTLGHANGVEYLVDIARSARRMDPTIAFVVIGDGVAAQAISARATSEGVLGDNFFLYPKIPKAEAPVAFAASTMTTSLFVPVPELEANSANKFFDSLAAGRPVAVNYGGWQPGVLAASGAGIRLSATSADCAATTLVDAMNDREWVSSAGRNARRLAVDRYARDTLAADLLAVLVRVGAGR